MESKSVVAQVRVEAGYDSSEVARKSFFVVMEEFHIFIVVVVTQVHTRVEIS